MSSKRTLPFESSNCSQQDPFTFLRGTFYRWMQLFPDVCKKAADAPLVLSVGDLHASNFGTWRDAKDELIWGINDFDEASPSSVHTGFDPPRDQRGACLRDTTTEDQSG